MRLDKGEEDRESWEDGREEGVDEVELDYKAALEMWYEDGVIGY